jgi:hypothetical protein
MESWTYDQNSILFLSVVDISKNFSILFSLKKLTNLCNSMLFLFFLPYHYHSFLFFLYNATIIIIIVIVVQRL